MPADLLSRVDDIRAWAAEGQIDTWIAEQLGTSAGSIAKFRNQQRPKIIAGHIVKSGRLSKQFRPVNSAPGKDDPGISTGVEMRRAKVAMVRAEKLWEALLRPHHRLLPPFRIAPTDDDGPIVLPDINKGWGGSSMGDGTGMAGQYKRPMR